MARARPTCWRRCRCSRPAAGCAARALAEMARGRRRGGFAVAAAIARRGRRHRHRHAGRRARAPPGPHQRRRRVRQRACRMALGAVADAGHGPAVRRSRRRAPPLPRPPRARAATRPCRPRRALRSRDARAQQAARRAKRRPIPTGSLRWRRAWPSMARRSSRRAPRTVADARRATRRAPEGPFARAVLALDGGEEAPISPRALEGGRAPRRRRRPHPRRAARADLTVTHRGKDQPAALLLDRRAEGVAVRPRSSPMPNWSPSVPAARPSCCSTRSPPISTRDAGRPCSSGWALPAARCG